MSAFNPKTRVWSGPKTEQVFNPAAGLGQILLHVFSRTPRKVAQISDNDHRKVTYGDMRRRSIAMARSLERLGVQKGDVVTLLARNNADLAPTVFGCFIVGAPINPLDCAFSKGDVAHMLRLVPPKLVFCEADRLEMLQEVLDEAEMSPMVVSFSERVDGMAFVDDLFMLEDNEEHFVIPNLGDSTKTTAAIICSSGTTGLPKGVCLSHAQLISQSMNFFQLHEDDVVLSFSSLYWISGLVTLLLGSLSNAHRVITTEPFSPKYLLSLFERYHVSFFFGAPVHFTLLLQCPDVHFADFTTLQYFVTGGALVSAHLRHSISQLIPHGKTYVMYGMSEACGVTSKAIFTEHPDESVGGLSAHAEAMILNEEERRLGPNETGQIYIRMKYSFLGYYQNEEATSQTLTPTLWLKTGDLGFFDEHGHLFVVGRSKDIIKYMGYQISPAEIESIIEKLPGIFATCVVGIPDPKGLAGELPAAAVVMSPNSIVTEDDIKEAVASELSDFKQLRGVYFVDRLPMTASGKVKASAVREMLIDLFKANN